MKLFDQPLVILSRVTGERPAFGLGDNTMNMNTLRSIAITAAILVTTGAANANSDLWLHVRVEGDGATKVSVNLPLSLVEKAMPMLPISHLHHTKIDVDGWDMEIADLRELWQEVKSSPDMTFVTVEEDREKVRVWKENDHLYVEVSENDGENHVNVRIPTAVIDAILEGEGNELNLRAGIEALAELGEGELVTVSEDDQRVRVWVDRIAEAR